MCANHASNTLLPPYPLLSLLPLPPPVPVSAG
jgi:hypothetical protein